MNTVVWKFPLNPVELGQLFHEKIPVGASFLSVGMQGGQLMVWALVDPDARSVDHAFYVIGTGHPAPVALTNFVGTVFDGSFVWHVFEFHRR